MKKLLTIQSLVFLFSFFSFHANAQAPAGFTFQSVLRDANNDLILNTTVGTRISILQGSSSGTAVYVETHSASTNANGLLTLEVGGGSVVSGTFSSIDWSNGPYFVKAETDPAGGTSYTITGTQQMMSVPYALYAATSGSGTSLPSGSSGQTLRHNGSGWVASGSLFNDGTKVGIGTTNPLQNLHIASVLKPGIHLEQTGSGNEQIWNVAGGAENFHIKDASNGNRTPFIINPNSLSNRIVISNENVGIGTTSPSFLLDVNGQARVSGAIRMEDGNQQAGYIPVSDANGNMTWTDPSTIVTAADGDGNSSNELQTLSQSGLNVTLSNGGGTVTIPTQTELADADSDTKIQVEESADEDMIRFDIAGTQQARISTNGNGSPLLELNSIGGNLYIGTNVGVSDMGGFNTFIGQFAGAAHNSGSNNTIIGSDAGRANSGGSDNTIIGAKAGVLSTGSGNVFLGSNSGYFESGNNKLYIHNDNSGSPLVYGEFDNRLIRVNGTFEARKSIAENSEFVATIRNTSNSGWANGLKIRAGQNTQSTNNRLISFRRPDDTEIGAVRQTTSSSIDFWSPSDQRLKTNIQTTTKGLTDLMQLQVKDYVYKDDPTKPQTGFIAQEVYEVFPNAVSVGGDDAKTDPWMMNYGKLTPLLVKAVQDLTELVENQQQEIEALKAAMR